MYSIPARDAPAYLGVMVKARCVMIKEHFPLASLLVTGPAPGAGQRIALHHELGGVIARAASRLRWDVDQIVNATVARIDDATEPRRSIRGPAAVGRLQSSIAGHIARRAAPRRTRPRDDCNDGRLRCTAPIPCPSSSSVPRPPAKSSCSPKQRAAFLKSLAAAILPRGVITAEQVPEALQRLVAAVEQEKAHTKEAPRTPTRTTDAVPTVRPAQRRSRWASAPFR